MAIESSVLGGGLLKFQLEEDVVIRHMSRLYRDAYSVVRELLSNEEAACITASTLDGFDHSRDCRMEAEYYPGERRLFIRGVNSLGIDKDTLRNVLSYYGRSLNADIANVSGQFGMGFKGFVQLTMDEKGGEQGGMVLRTHARKTGEKYAVLCTPLGFRPIADERAEKMDYYGTELEIVHKPGLEPEEIIETIRENAYLSPVQVYLTVVDDRPNAIPEEEYQGLSWGKQKEHVVSLACGRERISQHTLEDLLLANTGGEARKNCRRVRLSTVGYEAVAQLKPEEKGQRGRYRYRGSTTAGVYLVGRVVENAVEVPEHFDYLYINFRTEDVVEPTPSRDSLDGDQLKAFVEQELAPGLRKKAFEEFMPRVYTVEDYTALDSEARRRYDELYDVFADFLTEEEKKTRAALYHLCQGYREKHLVKDLVSRTTLEKGAAAGRSPVYCTDRFYRDQCEEYEERGCVVVKARGEEELGLFKQLGFQVLPRKTSKTRMEMCVHEFVDNHGPLNAAKDEPRKASLEYLERGRLYVMVAPESRLSLNAVIKRGLQSPNGIRAFKVNKTQEKAVRELIGQGEYTGKPMGSDGDSGSARPMPASVRSLEEFVEDALEEEVYTSRGTVKMGELLRERAVVVYNMEGGEDPEFYRRRMAKYWNETKNKGVLVPAIGDTLFKVLLALAHRGKSHRLTLGVAEEKERRYGGHYYNRYEGYVGRPRKEADARAYARVMLSAASNGILDGISGLEALEGAILKLECMDPVYAVMDNHDDAGALERLWSTPLHSLEEMGKNDILRLIARVKRQKYRNILAKILLARPQPQGEDEKEEEEALSAGELQALRASTTGEARELVEAELATRELRGKAEAE